MAWPVARQVNLIWLRCASKLVRVWPGQRRLPLMTNGLIWSRQARLDLLDIYSLRPLNGDIVVVDIDGERSFKI
jgi:hypothetical protein